MLETTAESHERVLDPLGLGLGEVAVGLDFPVDVLELGLQLLLRLDALHQHHVVVLVHFVQLVVHVLQGLISVLLLKEPAHVLRRQVTPRNEVQIGVTRHLLKLNIKMIADH